MLEVRYVFDQSLRAEDGQRLLGYLLTQGADQFSITVMALQDTRAPFADAFEDELAPYELTSASRRVLTTAFEGDLTRTIRLWTFNDSSLNRLLSFIDTGIFHWPAGPDGWLEDLTIYRDGELVLGLVSHEREGVLRLTRQEHDAVRALDIPSKTAGESVTY